MLGLGLGSTNDAMVMVLTNACETVHTSLLQGLEKQQQNNTSANGEAGIGIPILVTQQMKKTVDSLHELMLSKVLKLTNIRNSQMLETEENIKREQLFAVEVIVRECKRLKSVKVVNNLLRYMLLSLDLLLSSLGIQIGVERAFNILFLKMATSPSLKRRGSNTATNVAILSKPITAKINTKDNKNNEEVVSDNRDESNENVNKNHNTNTTKKRKLNLLERRDSIITSNVTEAKKRSNSNLGLSNNTKKKKKRIRLNLSMLAEAATPLIEQQKREQTIMIPSRPTTPETVLCNMGNQQFSPFPDAASESRLREINWQTIK